MALIASTGAVLDNADMLSHSVQNLRQRYLLMEHYHKFIALPEIQDSGEPLTDESPHIVFENVVFGDLSKLHDDDALQIALKMGLADGIAELDTPLGKLEENGVDISGGQWQRVAVARACLPDSAFVVLDEPTASLDPVAESNMYHSFAEVLKNRGSIMISHRLASARMADKIVVLSDGVVLETGSHDSLMTMDGLYARMYESQSAWYNSTEIGGEPA